MPVLLGLRRTVHYEHASSLGCQKERGVGRAGVSWLARAARGPAGRVERGEVTGEGEGVRATGEKSLNCKMEEGPIWTSRLAADAGCVHVPK